MRNLTTSFFLLLLALFISSCSGEEDLIGQQSTVDGTAVKGLLRNAKVDIYKLNNQGSRLDVLTTTYTDAQGKFSAQFEYRGFVEVVVSEGSYKDEATGKTVNLSSGDALSNMISAESHNEISVTALTTIAAARAVEQAAKGLATAIANANKEVAHAFGLGGMDISKTIPADISMSSSAKMNGQQKKYGAVLAGISQLAESNELSPEKVPALIKEIAEDFRDGKMDGMSRGAALSFALKITPPQALKGLQTAIAAFLKSPENISDLSPEDVNITVPVPDNKPKNTPTGGN